jgi:predicted GNAT family N-acyltransferase
VTHPAWRVAVVAPGTPDHAALQALRERLLRVPLGLRFTPDELAAEATDVHLAAWDASDVIGGVLLRSVEEGVGKLRQMAVSWQRRGVGAILVRALEDEARRRGMRHLVLHARDHATGFYARLGYAADGPPFLELGIPHVRMTKTLGATEAAR